MCVPTDLHQILRYQDHHQQQSRMKRRKTGKKKKKEQGGGMDVIPIVGGVFIVILIACLKLGMFSAIGGGAMGFTTGKMFSDHE
jgi:hypothetical protein